MHGRSAEAPRDHPPAPLLALAPAAGCGDRAAILRARTRGRAAPVARGGVDVRARCARTRRRGRVSRAHSGGGARGHRRPVRRVGRRRSRPCARVAGAGETVAARSRARARSRGRGSRRGGGARRPARCDPRQRLARACGANPPPLRVRALQRRPVRADAHRVSLSHLPHQPAACALRRGQRAHGRRSRDDVVQLALRGASPHRVGHGVPRMGGARRRVGALDRGTGGDGQPRPVSVHHLSQPAGAVGAHPHHAGRAAARAVGCGGLVPPAGGHRHGTLRRGGGDVPSAVRGFPLRGGCARGMRWARVVAAAPWPGRWRRMARNRARRARLGGGARRGVAGVSARIGGDDAQRDRPHGAQGALPREPAQR